MSDDELTDEPNPKEESAVSTSIDFEVIELDQQKGQDVRCEHRNT